MKITSLDYLLLFILFGLPKAANTQCILGNYCPPGMPQWTQDLYDGCVASSENELDCVSGTLPNAPSAFQPATWCTTIENNIFYPFEAQSAGIFFEVGAFNCQGGNGALQAAIFDCELNFVSDCYGNIPDGTSQVIPNTAPLVPGETYLLMLDGSAGSLCDFIINGALPTDPFGLNLCVGGNTGLNIGTYTSNLSGTWVIHPPSAGVIISPNPAPSVTIEWFESGQHEVCISVCPNGSGSCLKVNIGSPSETFLTYDVCESECITLDGIEYCSPGDYQINYINPSGCDSIVHITLTELEKSTFHDSIPLPCDGEFHFSGNILTDLNSTYEFYFSNSVGCDSLHTITLLPNSVFGEAGPTKNLTCTPSASVQLQGIVHYPTTNYSIEWATTNGHILVGQNTPTPTVDLIGTYCMTLTDQASGCKMTDCVEVAHGNETLVFAFNDYQVPCVPSLPAEISVSILSDSSDTFSWSTSDGNIIGEMDLSSITINQEGTYCLTVTKLNGCDSTACLEVYKDFSVNIIAPVSHCFIADLPIQFDVSYSHSASATLFYQLNGSNNGSINMDEGTVLSTMITFLDFTEIKAWVVDENECESDTFYHTILNEPIDILTNIEQNVCNEATISVTDFVSPAQIAWSNGESGIDLSSIIVTEDGIYSVYIFDGNNCYAEKDIYIELDYNGTCAYLTGSVKRDDFSNCSPDIGEPPFANWIIQAVGANGTFYGTTDAVGLYNIPVEPGDYVVSVLPISSLWQACQNDINTSLSIVDDEQVIDFLIQESDDCPMLRVDISSGIIRACQNNLYSVHYCNDGTAIATNAYIDVVVDAMLAFQNATVPFTDLGNNVVRFPIGDIVPNECGSFTFRTKADCNAPVGFTHCTEAHIYPDGLCVPPNPLWSRAVLTVTGDCSDSTRFTVKNVGTGGMAEPLAYTIFRNTDIYLFKEISPLIVGESYLISLPSDTSTWRIEVEQPPFYPYSPQAISTVQGCTPNGLLPGNNSFVNNMPLADQDGFIDEDCRPNVGSFDPNDKQASPVGYADAHFIADGTDIEYRIRFQNTGMDTAFSVVLKDTISNLLDISTLQMGASSHPYSFELIGNGILKIEFPSIRLPHKDVNELGSIGFIEFKIAANDGLPPLTVIKNTASIYFDRNEPVITNTVFHTIEKPVVHGYQKIDLCEGDEWNGIPYFADVVLTETFPFAEYDSMDWTDIQVTPPFDSTFIEFVCGNNPFEFHGEIYQTTGVYNQLVSSAIACDTIYTIIIKELPTIYTSIFDKICVGGTYELDGQIFDEPGEHFIEYVDQHGCDSFVILSLTSADSIFQNLEKEICKGSTYTFDNQELNTSGVYMATSQNAEGCEVNVVLDLQVNLLYVSMMTDQFCEGATYDFQGEILDAPGLYEKTLSAVDGCDSLVQLELMENDVFEIETEASICKGSVYDFHGTLLDSTGQYEVMLTSSMDCDSLVKLDLAVLPAIETPIEAQICEGGTYNFHGEILDTSGQYETTLMASTGCDSLIKLTLQVVDSFDISLHKEICEGDFYEFNGEELTEEGNYPAEYVSLNGCDSSVTLSLVVWPVHENDRTATICYGDSAEFNENIYDESGIYSDSLTSIHGCDSTETFELVIMDSIGSEFSAAICEGEVLDFHGQSLTEAGVYETVLVSDFGCDSTVSLFLEVETVYLDTFTEITLYGEVFQGIQILGDTILTENLLAQNGCDSIVTWLITAFTKTHENLAEQIGLTIYPNPTDHRFFIDFILAESQVVEIKIMDVVGRNLVFEKQPGHFPAGANSLEINAEHWPSGVYLVHFQMENGIAIERVLVN